MKHKFSCRVCAALLCILVFSAAVLSRPAALKASAASLALDGAALNEMSMVLWNLLMNALVACGVSAAVPDSGTSSGTISTPIGSYDAEAALYEALVDYYHVASVSGDGMVFTLQNGRTVALGELLELTGWDTVGTGARQIPDEATWQRFRVIDGGGSGSPDNDPQFTHLASFALDAGILLGISKFVEALQAGEIEGLDAADYFPDGFNGTLPRDADGYIVNGWLSGTAYINYGGQTVSCRVNTSLYDTRVNSPVVAYFYTGLAVEGMPDLGYVKFLSLRDSKVVDYSVLANIIYKRPDGDRKFAQTTSSLHANSGAYGLSIPVFSSRAAAVLFLQSGEFTGCENALQYDPSALPDALPDNFAPLTGTELDPSVFNSLFPALLSAIQGAFPQPQPNPNPDAEPEPVPLPDPVAGTAVFNKVVADTAADVAAEASPNPEPKPEPDVDTDIGSYKVNLTHVFPFCLPFDLIRLFDALDAEPVTPCFDFPFVVPALDIDMSVKIDLSFLDELMEIVRACETVSFIIALIFATPKLIRW